ncbi:PL10A [Symbiodinium sp. CCMP2456]|nr:PL10A [Symbiodinium sp. CCMP2456]
MQVFGPPKTRSTSGIDFDKYDAIPVQVSGENSTDVKPIVRFSEAKLVDSLFDNLRRCGYDRPTPVQKYSIPIVLSGRDLMACAQTGSGKTCAFMVPCLESLLRSGPPQQNSRGRQKPAPCGLCLAPTRELASQIHEESKKFAFDTGIRCCIIYGGADMREQRSELEGGCDVLIATPGRLTDMFERTFLSLANVQFFILDEADRMLDMGFEPQVRQIVKQTDMGKWSTVRLQSMMFSATFASEVQVMARDFLSDYLFITVGRVGAASELVTQKVVYADEGSMKVRKLDTVVKEHLPKDGLCVVFVETKRGADSLEIELHKNGISVAAIHGDRSQIQREEALAAFKTGANPILVATDVAARGLDIPNVSLVVNFDMPKQLDDYVHRIGRTGRAGRKGTAVAFVNERCAYLHDLYDILIEAKQDTPIWFEEMVRQARRPTGGKGGRRAERFGGSDIRADEKGSGTGPPPGSSLLAKPARAELPMPRAPDAFGNSGLEDAW